MSSLHAYKRMRTGIQVNAAPVPAGALPPLRTRLLERLIGTDTFHSLEVGHTADPDRLLIGLAAFAPDVSADRVGAALSSAWADVLRHDHWAAEHLLCEDGHVELQAATRAGASGGFLTVHLVATAAEAPASRLSPAAAASFAAARLAHATRRGPVRQAVAAVAQG